MIRVLPYTGPTPTTNKGNMEHGQFLLNEDSFERGITAVDSYMYYLILIQLHYYILNNFYEKL
jgi:hypothetical protein